MRFGCAISRSNADLLKNEIGYLIVVSLEVLDIYSKSSFSHGWLCVDHIVADGFTWLHQVSGHSQISEKRKEWCVQRARSCQVRIR